MTVGAFHKNDAKKICQDKGMMIFEPRNERIAKTLYHAAYKFGLKRYDTIEYCDRCRQATSHIISFISLSKNFSYYTKTLIVMSNISKNHAF